MARTSQIAKTLFCVFGLFLLSIIVRVVRRSRRTTSLKGPSRKSLIFGFLRDIIVSTCPWELYNKWNKEFGPVYSIPMAFGSNYIALHDPKAIAHFYSHETSIYVRDSAARRRVELVADRGLLWAEGESHKRQRRILNSAFSNGVIRDLTSVFFDSGNKVKTAWDALIDSGESEIDVQSWMNRVTLDAIGIAGFSHDFGTLHGEVSEVATALEKLSNMKLSTLAIANFVLSMVFPVLLKMPTDPILLTKRLNNAMEVISKKLILDSKCFNDKDEKRSAIGVLLKAENADEGLSLTPEEVLAQMKSLVLAGYETSSIILTWTLIHLSKGQDTQEKLRAELSRFLTSDPTWSQLTSDFPYMDAVVQEVLRLHAPITETLRQAAMDDVIPLKAPIASRDGRMIDKIFVPAGTRVVVPIAAINLSEAFWGPDAAEFNPNRWFSEDGIACAKDLQGYRHILTFADGQRSCVGKPFALAEIKAVLCTLIRSFRFEFKKDTEVGTIKKIMFRPQLVGEAGQKIPLLVHRV